MSGSYSTKNFTPSKRTLVIFVIWTAVHTLALITSYSKIPIFNDIGEPDTSKFWPFVPFTYTLNEIDSDKQKKYFKEQLAHDTIAYADSSNGFNKLVDVKEINSEAKKTKIPDSNYYVNSIKFSGVFNNYDWSEFMIYMMLFVVVYLLYKLSS